MDPLTVEPHAKDGLINVRDFSVRGEGFAGPGRRGWADRSQNGISFSRLRAEFTRVNGQLSVKDGVAAGPTIGATIEGVSKTPGNQVRIRGTFARM